MNRSHDASAPVLGADEALDRLAHDVWQDQLEESPIHATYLGDRRGDDRLDENGPEARERRRRKNEAFQERLAAIDPLEDPERELTRRVLDLALRQEHEEHEHRPWEHDVDHIFGLHLTLQNLVALQGLEDEAAYARLVRRLEEVPRAFAEHVADLRAGRAAGRDPPRVAVERVLGQLDAFVDTPAEETPFVAVAWERRPRDWPETTALGWRARLAEVVETAVRPAYRRYRDVLREEVLPSARQDVGVWAIPGGDALYAWRARVMTTTDLPPERIHEIGREELERNRDEMLAIARAEGHRGDLASFLAALRDDPRHRLPTEEAILERYRAICARMDAALPRAFGRLPRAGYEIRPVESWRAKDAPAAFYQRPTQDGSRKGVFYANTHEPSSWPVYDFEALCFHEAVPGHHLQIALAQEIEGLPDVRRQGGFTAYVEGWAHYTERLADEMGLYSSPLDRLGMLSGQAWRAARLVVDTGMHHARWEREEAVAILREIRAGPEADVQNEVDRYVIWPGQALAYKVGSRTITDLREACRRRLGPAFDLQAFHDEVLAHGALPLALLAEVLQRWDPRPAALRA